MFIHQKKYNFVSKANREMCIKSTKVGMKM